MTPTLLAKCFFSTKREADFQSSLFQIVSLNVEFAMQAFEYSTAQILILWKM